MKIARFTLDGSTRLGIVEGDKVLDAGGHDPTLPTDLVAVLAGPGLAAVAAAAIGAPELDLAGVRLEAPLAMPPTFLAIGLNYRAHVEESGMHKPDVPIVFNKQIT